MGPDAVYNPDGYCTYRNEKGELCYATTPCGEHPIGERMAGRLGHYVVEGDPAKVEAVTDDLLGRDFINGFSTIDDVLYLRKLDGRTLRWVTKAQ